MATHPTAQFEIFKRLKLPVHASHRGGSSYAPQNTLHSFRKCVVEDKTDMLEFDVHLTKDGHLVLNHNLSIDATTNGTGLIEHMTLAELREFDAAYHFSTDSLTYPHRGAGFKIPTLLEVLEEFVPNENLVFLVDFKHKNAVAPTLKVLEDFKILDRVILGAVPPAVNKELLRLRPKTVPVIADAKTMLYTVGLHQIGLINWAPIKHEVVGFYVDTRTIGWITDLIITRLLKMGYWIGVFGPLLDDPNIQKRFIDLGVQLIVTDRPDVLRKTIASYTPVVSD